MESDRGRDQYWRRKNYWEEKPSDSLSLVPYQGPTGRENEDKQGQSTSNNDRVDQTRKLAAGRDGGASPPGDDDQPPRNPRPFRRATIESVSNATSDDEEYVYRRRSRYSPSPERYRVDADLESGLGTTRSSDSPAPPTRDGKVWKSGYRGASRERIPRRVREEEEEIIIVRRESPRERTRWRGERNSPSPPPRPRWDSTSRLVEYGTGSYNFSDGRPSTSRRRSDYYEDDYVTRRFVSPPRSRSKSRSRNRESRRRRVSFGSPSRRSSLSYYSSASSSPDRRRSKSRPDRHRSRSRSRFWLDSESDSDDSFAQTDYDEYRRKSSRFASESYARPKSVSRSRNSSRHRLPETIVRNRSTSVQVPIDIENDLGKDSDVVVELGESANFHPTALKSRPTADVSKVDDYLAAKYRILPTKANIINATRYYDGLSNLPVAFQYYESATASAERDFRWIHCQTMAKNLKAIEMFVTNRAELTEAEKVLCKQVFRHVENFVRKSSTANCRLPPLSRCYRGASSDDDAEKVPWVIFMNMPYLRRTSSLPATGSRDNETVHANSLMHYRYSLKRHHKSSFQEEADYCYLCERDEVEVPMTWAILTSSNVLITICDEDFDAMHQPSFRATKISDDQVRENSRKVILQDQEWRESKTLPLRSSETYFALFTNAEKFFLENRSLIKGDFLLQDVNGNTIDSQNWESYRKQSRKDIIVTIINDIKEPREAENPNDLSSPIETEEIYRSRSSEARVTSDLVLAVKRPPATNLTSALVPKEKINATKRPSPSAINEIIQRANNFYRERTPSARRTTLPPGNGRYVPPTFTPSSTFDTIHQSNKTETDSTLRQESNSSGENSGESKMLNEPSLQIPPFFLWPTDIDPESKLFASEDDSDDEGDDNESGNDGSEGRRQNRRGTKVRFQSRNRRGKAKATKNKGGPLEDATRLTISTKQRNHLELVLKDVEDNVLSSALVKAGRERARFFQYYDKIKRSLAGTKTDGSEINRWLTRFPPLKSEFSPNECTWQRSLSTVLELWAQICDAVYPANFNHPAFNAIIGLRVSFLKSIVFLCEPYYVWYTKSNSDPFNAASSSGPWLIRDVSTMLDSRLAVPAKLSISIENCSKCNAEGSGAIFLTRQAAMDHLRQFHMPAAQIVDSELSQYIVLYEHNKDVEAGLVSMMVMGIMIDRLSAIKAVVERLQEGVIANGQFIDSVYHQPQSLIGAFQEILYLSYYSVYVIQSTQENYQSMLPGSYVTADLLEMEWLPELETCGNDVLFSLEAVAQDLMTMAYDKNSSAGLTHEPVGPGYFLCLLLNNLCDKTRDKGGSQYQGRDVFDIVMDYEEKVEKLELKAKKRPQRKYRREMTPLQDELSVITEVLNAQWSLAGEVQDLLKPNDAKQRRQEDWDLECQALREFRKEAQLQLADCRKLSRDLERMERKLAQDLDIEDGDHGKAILIFTITTVIFLPLSFVTSYLGMNTVDLRDMGSGQWLFWTIAIPLTSITVASVMIIGYHGDDLRELWSRIERHGFSRLNGGRQRQITRQQHQHQLARKNSRSNGSSGSRRGRGNGNGDGDSVSRSSSTVRASSASGSIRTKQQESLNSSKTYVASHDQSEKDAGHRRKRDWLRKRSKSQSAEPGGDDDDGQIDSIA